MKKVGKQISQKKEEKIQEESQKIDAKKNNLEPASKVDPSKNLSKKKEKWTPKRILNLVLDIVLFPILIFATCFSLSLIITKITKGVPMVFGYAMITVVSGSMRDAGFEVGDKAFIKQTEANELAVGDYIAFFDYVDPAHPRPATIANGEKPTSNPRKNRIVFHEIIKIETDANGDLWFRTKGTNNASADYNVIYQDYVIGKHVDDGKGIVKFFKFVNSTTGIVLLVIIPCVIILFRDCYELMTMVFEYSDEKKKIKREKEIEVLKTARDEDDLENPEEKAKPIDKNDKSE
jgi:signal peptidase